MRTHQERATCHSGACLFVPQANFEKIGGFDGPFFLNFEDIEFSWRLTKHGAFQFLPFLRLVHEVGSTQRADWGDSVYCRLDAHRTYIDMVQHGWRRFVAKAILIHSTCQRLLFGGVFFRGDARTRLVAYLKALGSALRQRTP